MEDASAQSAPSQAAATDTVFARNAVKESAGEIVNATLPMMQWQVNEQCVEYGECETFQPFIEADKPVFHIEYPKEETKFSTAQLCGKGNATLNGFSTVLKNMDLDDVVTQCTNS